MNNMNMQDIGYSSKNDARLQADLHEPDPKNKLSKEEKITNKQDDNSYDESDSEKTNSEAKKETTNQIKFEYSDNGEFVNDTQINDSNPNDEFL